MTAPSVTPNPSARNTVRSLVASQIREVANAGMGDPDILAFWFGEPDEVTPGYIRDTGIAAIAAGETFYTQNFGIPELRAALASYVSRLHRPVSADRIAVTASGMSALMLATQALVNPGHRVVCVTPLWPNLTEIPKILGAEVTRVALRFDRGGWTLSADEQQAILGHCRKHGIWIIADDVYERLYYAGAEAGDACAPSFLDIAAADDRLVSTNSFSKAWLMTGWRLGWIVAPPALMADLGKLIEYNTSCSPVFVQRAGVVAIEHGEPTVAHTLSRFRKARDQLTLALSSMPRVETALPAGAMYAFFRVEGVSSSLDFCKQLVHDAKLGLAPGSAFGPEGEGFVRWCFAASEERLAEGIARLSSYLQRG